MAGEKPAARLTDMHTCPMVTGLVPHVGGPIAVPGAPTVLIGSLPAARVTDTCICVGPPDSIIMGSPTVYISGLMAARMGDPTAHGGVITVGMPTVMIGVSGAGSTTVAGGAGGFAGGNSLGLDGPMLKGLWNFAKGLALTIVEAVTGKPPLTEAELVQARQAVVDAKQMLLNSRAQVAAWDDKTKAEARRWFGDDSPEVQQKMLDRIDKQITKLSSMGDANFERANAMNRDAYAYVYPNDDTKIYLGDPFWRAPATGKDSKAGTLVHEMSHYKSVSGTSDHAYGEQNCEDLAIADPEAAQDNADSFEYFMEHMDGSNNAPFHLH